MNTETIEHPVIALQPVESSQLAAIGYHAETQTLAIQFKGKNGPGSIYHYANFTAEDFAAFLAAESQGSHFKRIIKPAQDKFPYVKVS